MRAFGAPGYLIRDARLEIRFIYTAFLLLVLVGMATMAGFEIIHVGPTPARIAAYYRGGERAGEMAFGKTFRELVEVTHFHSFSMGVVYLILAHLFVATTVSPSVKRTMILVAFAGLLGDIVCPWLVRYAAGAFAYLLVLAWLAEWVGFLAFIWVPLVEMWSPNGREHVPPE